MQDLLKFHIGCGPNILDGWLNADLTPEPNAIAIDAASVLPFDNCSFSHVFSEHFIEHLDYKEATSFASECWRVLVPGGRIRTATPDLRFLIQLYDETKTDTQREYLEWAARTFLPDIPVVLEAFIINNFFRAWGHKFIHDEQTLTLLLRTAGFEDIRRYRPGISDDPALCNLESHGRWIPQEVNDLETFVLEAVKPSESRVQP
jgi:predicted SAM-dependent methyltransferase